MNTTCKNCNCECPSGTLENGFCNLCNMIGKTVMVSWRGLGNWLCEITSVSKNGNVYAKRWFIRSKRWSKPVRIEYYKGWYVK